jgi:UDP-GlcNAc:undecaprenyl-phosphate GlcNAc-1-phosphate transferase
MLYVIPFMTAFGIVYFIIPALRWIALRYNFVDRPNHRKIHSRAIPLLGGVALYAGIILAMLAFNGVTPLSSAIALGGTILLITGLLDDRAKTKGKDFPVWPRMIIYLAASTIPVWFGIDIVGISNWGGPGMLLFPEWLVWVATTLWVFGIMNMINFIDGVDGLASGIILIASFTLFVCALLTQQEASALLAIILVGSCTAFLVYNFHPAKIFMGDAGAIVLGYTVAVVSIEGALKSATLVTVGVSVLALGVPILDTAIVMTRRLMENKGLHKADKLHTHHSLMKWGLSQTQTVSFMYLVGGLFSLLAVIVLLLFG